MTKEEIFIYIPLVNKSDSSCKIEKEMEWSRDERRGLVEGNHGGQNGGEEDMT